MPAAPKPTPEETLEPEEDLALPPLDADDADDGDRPELDALESSLDESGLDELTAVDLDVGPELDDIDELGADDTTGEIDVGPLEDGLVTDEGSAAEGEAMGFDDDNVVVDEDRDDDDGGAEGTKEDPGDDVDEAALPEMDDGEDNAGDDELAETLLAEASVPRWAASRWAPLEGAGSEVPCRAVAACGGQVAAAGEVLLMVEDGARAARQLAFGEGALAVALAEDALLVANARGQLLLARDHGAETSSFGQWRSGLAPTIRSNDVELAATPGRFWIRAGTSLSSIDASGHPLTRVRERGVLAITAVGGVLLSLSSGTGGPAIERFRGDDEGWAEAPLPDAARAMAERCRGTLRVAAAGGGRSVALCDQQRVAVSRDGGASFSVLELSAVRAIAFAGADADAPLLALVAPEGGGSGFIAEVDAAGAPERVAEIAGPGREATALSWDASREVVWVACAAGLLALGRPQRH